MDRGIERSARPINLSPDASSVRQAQTAIEARTGPAGVLAPMASPSLDNDEARNVARRASPFANHNDFVKDVLRQHREEGWISARQADVVEAIIELIEARRRGSAC